MLRNLSPWPVLAMGAILGLGGLALLGNLIRQWPYSPDQNLTVAFFIGLWLLLTGLSLPLIWLLHRRFGRPDAGEDWRSLLVLLRQTVWVGTWGTACAWLQMNRTLNWAMALLMMIVLILLEALLLTRGEVESDL